MYRENKHLTGTPRYASINNHLGIEQSRRDDLESLGYVFMYFLRGSLPWQGLRAKDKQQKYDRIQAKKMATTTEALTYGCPPCFREYVDYSKSLGFMETPDYAYCRRLFQGVAAREGIEYDGMFDWVLQQGPAPSPRWPTPSLPPSSARSSPGTSAAAMARWPAAA